MKQHVSIEPAMPPQAVPTWGHARWIGMLDVEDFTPEPDGSVEFVARHADGYRWARVLIRRHRVPVAFVEAPIDGDTVRLQIPSAADIDEPVPAVSPPVSVVLCTRDRPDQLADALQSLLSLDYPEFEIVVVDNASRTDATAQVVAALGDPRVRRVCEPVPGLSTARNTGLRAARHAVVAFTDDDVVVDPQWLQGLARGFGRAAQVTCVSGLVPSGELRTAAQAYFDQRVSWAESLRPRVYSMATPPADQPLFPFQVGRFGTGANFAVVRDRILELGGFDEALGAGTPSQGGEDLDIFFRVLTAGDTLATEPAAIVWHRHRSDNDALLKQARGYGLGLGAWLTKVALDAADRRLAARVIRRRFRSSLRAGADYGAIMASANRVPSGTSDNVPTSVGRTEVLSVLAGPRALWLGRRQQARNRAGAGPR
ncbi:glycosyltransferase involved in cell wall biosynthesis [Mycolicibacterium iranicum]|uniref:Glycosyltransferase involved in cell wall biosynthesis n=2 Tax=Mycolicibacterium iranicum TaxID=912594 RepID=A0A839Q4Q5_MYCIR|nr:glycosyltransferase involved in cell wall biosynthesis [Mycolicibacterium iranicum]